MVFVTDKTGVGVGGRVSGGGIRPPIRLDREEEYYKHPSGTWRVVRVRPTVTVGMGHGVG